MQVCLLLLTVGREIRQPMVVVVVFFFAGALENIGVHGEWVFYRKNRSRVEGTV